jgi:hypothetical protein
MAGKKYRNAQNQQQRDRQTDGQPRGVEQQAQNPSIPDSSNPLLDLLKDILEPLEKAQIANPEANSPPDNNAVPAPNIPGTEHVISQIGHYLLQHPLCQEQRRPPESRSPEQQLEDRDLDDREVDAYVQGLEDLRADLLTLRGHMSPTNPQEAYHLDETMRYLDRLLNPHEDSTL